MKYSFILFFGFIPCILFAQFQRDYVQAEIQFKNGEILKGWIYDEFAQNNDNANHDHKGSSYVTGTSTFETGSRYADFPTVLKKIQYKGNYEDGQQINYESETIDHITTIYPNGVSKKYKTLRFIRPSLMEDKQTVSMDTVNRLIWAPVIKEGDLNMYGYFTWSDYKRSSWSEVYFQKENQEYAYQIFMPYKFTWGIDGQRPYIKKGIEEAFGDCSYIAENLDSVTEKFIEDLILAFSKYNAQEKERIKSHPKNERLKVEYQIMENRSYVPYHNLYDLYLAHCQK